MDQSKLSGALQLGLLYPNYISGQTFQYITGQERDSENWNLLLRYYGDLEKISEEYEFSGRIINENFAYIYIAKEKIRRLSDEINVIYIEIPIVMNYILDENAKAICLTESVYNTNGFGVSGKKTLVGIIDSGIDYFHDDFRNEDGTTRIISLWDQTNKDDVETPCECGVVYTREQINEALNAITKDEGLRIVPSRDLLGHGTAIAGIAVGNGRASNGRVMGVAPEAEIVVVKVGVRRISELDVSVGGTTAQVMLGIDYILKEAIRLERPVSINIGLGDNIGLHDGQSSLEVFIEQATLQWRNNIVIGTGNQANKESHASGQVKEGESQSKSIFIDQKQRYYLMTVVYGAEDTINVAIKAPNGEITEKTDRGTPNQVSILGNNSVLINFSGPNNVSYLHQVNVLIDQYEGGEIASGVWEIILYGEEIVVGTYNIWGTSVDPLQRLTRFLAPDPVRTLNVPSTSSRVTSVGAVNGLTKQLATFSGRGYPLTNAVKPECVAPGMNVIAPTSLSDNGYAMVTGTSAAAAFATGAYALFYEYGINKRPRSYYYGEALKAVLIRAASRQVQNGPYPNPSWGYGILCIEETLELLKTIYST